MKNINTIWISTTPRTGSTWIFNVTREIYRILGFTVEPSIVPQKDNEMFKIYHDKAINQNNENIKYVLKTHSILKPDLIRSKIITSIRDPRDLCLSYKKFMKTDFNRSFKVTKSLIDFTNTYQYFKNNYLILIKYENIEKESTEIILNISKFLNVSITHSQAVEISKKYSRDNVIKIIKNKNNEINDKILKKTKLDEKEIVFVSKKLSINEETRAFDTSTGFQTGHISQSRSTSWSTEFSTNEKKILNDTFKDWLLKFKY